MDGATGSGRLQLLVAAYHFQHARIFDGMGSHIIMKNVQVSFEMIEEASSLERKVFEHVICRLHPALISRADLLTLLDALRNENTKALKALMSHLDEAITHEASWHTRFPSQACDDPCTHSVGRLVLLMNRLLTQHV